MKNIQIQLHKLSFCLLALCSLFVMGCDDDDGIANNPTGNVEIYALNAVAGSGVSGDATFTELSDGSTEIELNLIGTQAGNSHPAHVHLNTAAEGGAIAISLTPVDGASGNSRTIVNVLDDGTAVSFPDLLNFDGYINVHLSADDLATIVAQGDIGQNVLTGEAIVYDLAERAVPGISGSVTFSERLNGEALAEISLSGTPDGGSHPAHIHMNTAVEGGAIAYTFTPVDGTTGTSVSNVAALDDETPFGYSEILDYDGYVNVHLSADDLATIVAQGDIGQNDLTGATTEYDLAERDVAGINGSVTFSERVNGEALAQISLVGTPDGGSHPAHIHMNTAAEGGAIAYTFTPVDGTSGISLSNLAALDDGTSFGYAEVLDYDGYVNVHLSADDLATIVAQGDIGQNDLTGENIVYTLEEKDVPGISGTATFFARANGKSLAVLSLVNTPDGGSHPAHIHANSAAEGGPIIFTFNPVDGTTGNSRTTVEMLDDGTSFDYSDIASTDGYINVHLSADDLATIVAQGNIGINEGM